MAKSIEKYDYPFQKGSSSKALTKQEKVEKEIIYAPKRIEEKRRTTGQPTSNESAEKSDLVTKNPVTNIKNENNKKNLKFIGGEYSQMTNSSNYSILSNDNERSMNLYINDESNYINNQEREVKTDNPALKVMNFSKFSRMVLEELNFARKNPSTYAKKLEKIMIEDVEEKVDEIYINDSYNLDNNALNINKNNNNGTRNTIGTLWIDNYPTKLKEGKKSFIEAIKFLKNQRSLPPLKTSEGLLKSAEDLNSIVILHDGGYGKEDALFNSKLGETKTRMNKYGAAVGEISEIIDYGNFSPEYVIIGFIVCDGDPTRYERNLIFNDKIKHASACSGIIPSERICTVINFAEFYYEKGDFVPSHILDKYKINPKNTDKVPIPHYEIKKQPTIIKTENNSSSANKFRPSNNSTLKDPKMETIIKDNKFNTINLNSEYFNPNNNVEQIKNMNYVQNENDEPNKNNNDNYGNDNVITNPAFINIEDNEIYSKPKMNYQLNSFSPNTNLNKTPIDDNYYSNYNFFNSPMNNTEVVFNETKSSNFMRPIESFKGDEWVTTDTPSKKKICKVLSQFKSNQNSILKSPVNQDSFVKQKNDFSRQYPNQDQSILTNHNQIYPNYSPNPIVKLDIDSFENPKREVNVSQLPLNKINNIYNSDYFIISSAKNSQVKDDISSNRLAPSNSAAMSSLRSYDKDFAEYEIDFDIDQIEKIPEKIKSIQIIEKPLPNTGEKESNPAEVKKIVKKIINFNDGTNKVIFSYK